jgi:hypothetical protein
MSLYSGKISKSLDDLVEETVEASEGKKPEELRKLRAERDHNAASETAFEAYGVLDIASRGACASVGAR